AVMDFVQQPDELSGAELQRNEQKRSVDHVGDPDRPVNQRRDRDEHAHRFPVQFFQMTRGGMERESKGFTEYDEAKEDRPDAADCGHKEDAPPAALRVESDRRNDSKSDE